MNITNPVKNILRKYEGELPSVKLNLARLFMNGKLGGIGKILILAVDQGFEHGPTTFLNNYDAFDPHYHFELAKESEISAYTAPLGWLRAGAETYLGQVPLILKINHSCRLYSNKNDPDQSLVGSVQDAVDMGCIGIGFTLYPGSDNYFEQLEELQRVSSKARQHGLFTIVWAYPRGSAISFSNESVYSKEFNNSENPQLAIDTIAYSAHMACLAGAHIVKVNIPENSIVNKKSLDLYKDINFEDRTNRIRYIVDCCFKGNKAVIFSGGASKESSQLLEEINDIRNGGGFGSIIGRNIFQRPKSEALKLIDKIIGLYNE